MRSSIENWEIARRLRSPGLTTVRFVDSDLGFGIAHASWKSLLYMTVDGGANWQSRYEFSDLSVESIVFKDREYGLAAGGRLRPSVHPLENGGEVMRTTDGGRNWQSVLLAPKTEITGVFLGDSGEIVVTGRKAESSPWSATYAMFVSSDGGLTWSDRTAALETALEKSQKKADLLRDAIVADERIVVLSARGIIAESKDQGATWALLERDDSSLNGLPVQWRRLGLDSESGIWLLAGGMTIEGNTSGLKTPNSKSAEPIRFERVIFADFVLTPNGAIVVGQTKSSGVDQGQEKDAGAVLITNDKGATWNSMDGVGDAKGYKAIVPKGNGYFVLSDDGASDLVLIQKRRD